MVEALLQAVNVQTCERAVVDVLLTYPALLQELLWFFASCRSSKTH